MTQDAQSLEVYDVPAVPFVPLCANARSEANGVALRARGRRTSHAQFGAPPSSRRCASTARCGRRALSKRRLD
jgi:hypothetical protein